MKIKNKANQAVVKILDAFKSGDIPKAIAYSMFDPPENIPAYKWSLRNRILSFLQGTGDSRGLKQWAEVGRRVKKGSKAIYIVGPVLIKSKKKTDDTEEDKIKCIGYRPIPVFRMEDTEGEPVEYAPLDIKQLPLIDVAEKWGIEVNAGWFMGNYGGYYSHNKKVIILATEEEVIFAHELCHASHFKIDNNAAKLPKWKKEVVAELSAAAVLYMIGKKPKIGNHLQYINNQVQGCRRDPLSACMQVLDICIKVVELITSESNLFISSEVAA